MKNKLFMLAAIIFMFSFILNCKSENANNKNIPAGTNISFRDDFTGKATPNSFWTLCWPELTNDNDPTWNTFFKNTEGYECVRVEDGYLKLMAKKEEGGQAGEKYKYKTGGVWSSQNKYGIGTSLKVRAKLVQEEQKDNFNVPAAFPAIWYYPLFTTEWWPSSGEIDIMEWVSIDSNYSHSTIHYRNTNENKNLKSTKKTTLNVADWHVYRCDWYSNNVVIYYDDVEILRHTNNNKDTYPFNDHYYNIILNASLQNKIKSEQVWSTAVEDNDSNLPYELWVDWVEVSLIDKETGKPL